MLYHNNDKIQYQVNNRIYTGVITNDCLYDSNNRYYRVQRLTKSGKVAKNVKYDDFISQDDIKGVQ